MIHMIEQFYQDNEAVTDFNGVLSFMDMKGSNTVFWNVVLAFSIHYFKHKLLQKCWNWEKWISWFYYSLFLEIFNYVLA